MAKKRGDNKFKCIKCPELIEAEIYVDPALIAVEGMLLDTESTQIK